MADAVHVLTHNSREARSHMHELARMCNPYIFPSSRIDPCNSVIIAWCEKSMLVPRTMASLLVVIRCKRKLVTCARVSRFCVVAECSTVAGPYGMPIANRFLRSRTTYMQAS
eukprot:453581-Pleurochrysis_carterae.AAC.1